MQNISKPRIVAEPPGPKAKKIISRDKKVISPSVSRTAPLVGVEAEGVWVRDIDDNIFLDFGAGIAVANIGHRHPEVVDAIIKQTKECDHINSFDYFTVPQVEYAEMLQNILPGKSRKKFFFANSGTESVECAIKLARYHSRKLNFLAYIQSFHGRTMGALSFTSTSNKARKFFGPTMPGAILVPYPYCYRCPFKLNKESCSLHCLTYIKDYILKYVTSPEDVAGIFLEPLLGAGGYVIPPDDYWPKLYDYCKKNDILFIADEVQTGFARTGKMWAVEHWNLEPDIMCMSKAAAGGLPFGICASTEKVMDWEEGAHENTLGGNPIIVSAAKAVLNVIKREKLWENANKVGNHIRKRLIEIQENNEVIGDVRGKGLMIGIEFVKDRETKEPAVDVRDELILRSFKNGLLLLGAGVSSVRLAPPLVLTIEQADAGIEIMEKVIKDLPID